ncbi:MAG: tRNA-dihydrouridine synthase [Planctomycetota bacterium]
MPAIVSLGKPPESTHPKSKPRSAGPTLGGLRLDAPFYQAGLAGYSDAAMRLVARAHGCPYCVTEAMLDRFLIAGGKGLKAAEVPRGDHPICGQLMGSHPDDIAAGAKVLVGLGYDVVDVNLACPVKKIKKKCRGGHLLSVPDEAVAILEAVKAAAPGSFPLTVKLRRSYDETPAMRDAFDRVLTAAIDLGYAGATVHCRTVQQKYVGPGRWVELRDIAERFGLGRYRNPEVGKRNPEVEDAVPPLASGTSDFRLPLSGFVLGGSGDIWTAADIFRMIDATGVDWVSVARGCIGNPWLFAQAHALMAGRAATPPTVAQQRGVLLEHFRLSVDLHGEAQASRMMRKFGIRFSRHHPEADAIKSAFIRVKSTDDWRAVLDDYYTHDGPGVGGDAALPEEAVGPARVARSSVPEGCCI